MSQVLKIGIRNRRYEVRSEYQNQEARNRRKESCVGVRPVDRYLDWLARVTREALGWLEYKLYWLLGLGGGRGIIKLYIN